MRRRVWALVFLLFGSITASAQTKEADNGHLPIDVTRQRVTLRYKGEVDLFLPEGEFNASLQKRIGHFATQGRARYNYVHGEMGFALRNTWTRYQVMPHFSIFDELYFVPFYESTPLWRREQGMAIGSQIRLRPALTTSTSIRYYRLSSPSFIDKSNISSSRAIIFGQSFQTGVDSLDIAAAQVSAEATIHLERSIPVAASTFDATRLAWHGRLNWSYPWLALTLRLRSNTLLAGNRAPLLYLGGMHKMAAFGRYALSGLALQYAGIESALPLSRSTLKLSQKLHLSYPELLLTLEYGKISAPAFVLARQAEVRSMGVGLRWKTDLAGKFSCRLFAAYHAGAGTFSASKFYVGAKL